MIQAFLSPSLAPSASSLFYRHNDAGFFNLQDLPRVFQLNPIPSIPAKAGICWRKINQKIRCVSI